MALLVTGTQPNEGKQNQDLVYYAFLSFFFFFFFCNNNAIRIRFAKLRAQSFLSGGGDKKNQANITKHYHSWRICGYFQLETRAKVLTLRSDPAAKSYAFMITISKITRR